MDKNQRLVKLAKSDKVSFGHLRLEDQAEPQRIFSAIWELESEINNGGFSQYFMNTPGSVRFSVWALKSIGAIRMSDICMLAIESVFPEGLPQDEAAIASATSNLPQPKTDALDKLSREFMAYPENLTDLLFTYVSKYPEEFGSVSEP